MSDYSKRIARGVALLDERVPGWLARVDADLLDMRSGCFPLGDDEEPEAGRAGCGCVLAQIDYEGENHDHGSYFLYAGRLGLNAAPTVDSDNHAWRYGFTAHPSVISQDDDAPYHNAIDALTDKWKATILRLRSERAPC